MAEKITLLYIGSRLSEHGVTPQPIEVLGKVLEEKFNLIYSSSKKNMIIRMLDMIYTLIKNKSKISYVIIDTYSGWSFYYALIISLLCQFFNIKYIPFLHGGNLESRLINNPKLSRIIFANSYVNISPSEFHKSNFERYGFICHTIPNVIDLKMYPYNERRKIKPKLLWVRSFQYGYNPTLAIEIVKDLIELGYSNTHLTMVGPIKDSSYDNCIDLINNYSLKNNVDVVGLKTKQEWIEISKEKDIFLNTTNVDNTPVSVIEAMALGMVVISTNVGGIPNIINGTNGLLVQPNDVNLFVKEIIRLIQDSNSRYSINARKYSLKYDKKEVLEMWSETLR